MNNRPTTVKVLADVARVAGITADQARYWISLLGIETQKSGRNRLLSEHDAAQLEAMASMVAQGRTPQAAAAVLTAAPVVATVPTVVEESAPNSNLPTVVGRFESLERAIMALIEANQRTEEKHLADIALLIEANRQADERHRSQVAALEAKLEAKLEVLTEGQTRDGEARRIADERARSDAKDLQSQMLRVVSEVAAKLEVSSRNSAKLAEPVKPVTPWQPATKPDPMEGKPLWYRAWCEVFSPERMRRH